MTDVPNGQRFSHNYLSSPQLLPDSPRMRRRMGHLFGEFFLGDFGTKLAGELGIRVDASSTQYANYWPPFLEKVELRDVLDAITLRYKYLRLHPYDQTGTALATAKAKFLSEARRIFSEECVRYRIDDQCGIHFAVDIQYERTRIATIGQLGQARYSGVKELFEAAYLAMDSSPPDGKSAIRNTFFAAESLFRLMHPNSHQLSAAEVQKQLKPRIDTIFESQKPAIYAAQKQLAAFREWIDGAHFYRHEPGTEEPAQPPIDLAIYMISQGAAHIRWLATLDKILA
jgi:hypothetical protein